MEHSEDKFGVLYSSDGKKLIGVQDKKKFCCSHYSIKDGVKYIEPNAFHQCQNLKSIYMPDSVTDDGGSIFEGCRNLEQARISAKLKNPNIAMFNGCSSLAEVELPEGIESIGENMFSGCVSLTKINIPSTVQHLMGDTFCASGIEAINLPEGLKTIGYDAFINCRNLRSLTIPATVEEIGPWLVQGHKNFEGIICKSERFRIEDEAFVSNEDNSLIACWTKASTYHIPASVKNVKSVCNNQIEVLYVNYPLDEIGYEAFICCPKLKQIVYNAKVKKNWAV
jgi:hypothetical protein